MGMLERFRNAGETINPDNRFRFNYNDDTDTIIVGGSCEHVFEFPFIYSKVVASCDIIYRQGISVIKIVEVTMDDVEEIVNKFESIIKVNLTPQDTSLFTDSTLDTYAQAKITTREGEVLYDEPHKIFIKAPITVQENLYKETYYLKIEEEHCKVMVKDINNKENVNPSSCAIVLGRSYDLKISPEPEYVIDKIEVNDEEVYLPYNFKGDKNIRIKAVARKSNEK